MNHQSKLEHTKLSMFGVAELKSVGKWVTVAPAFDDEVELFARLTFADQVKFAESLGGHVGSVDEHMALVREGHYVAPVTLWPCPMHDIDTYIAHDKLFWARAAMTNWDLKTPLLNAGKGITIELAGNIANIGWWERSKGRFIQNPGHRHGPEHWDYSQLTTVFWDTKEAANAAFAS